MITIIPRDRTMSVDGTAIMAVFGDSRILLIAGQPDIHSLQFDEDIGVGHIEFIRDLNDTNPKSNKKIIASDIDLPGIHKLFETLQEEAQVRIEESHEALMLETAEANVRWDEAFTQLQLEEAANWNPDEHPDDEPVEPMTVESELENIRKADNRS